MMFWKSIAAPVHNNQNTEVTLSELSKRSSAQYKSTVFILLGLLKVLTVKQVNAVLAMPILLSKLVFHSLLEEEPTY